MLLGIVAALSAGELLYRLTRVAGLSPTSHPGYVQHDDELGWRYRPNARARHVSSEFAVDVAINPQGFRGEPWPERDARPLVLVLGDSFAFGWGVEEHDSLTGILRAQHPAWDVRGAGVSGYGTDQQLVLLRQLAPKLRPDVVVVVFCANDLIECGSDAAYGRDKPRFELRGDALTQVRRPGAESWLGAHSQLFRAVRKLTWQYNAHAEADWRLLRALFAAMQQTVAPAPVVLVGDRDQLEQRAKDAPSQRFVDTREVLATGSDWWFARDRHWTAAGHGKVAAAIADAVASALAERTVGRR